MTAKQFKQWRERMGWTQAEAGDALGLHRKTISNYECGKEPVRKVQVLATERLTDLQDIAA